MQGGTTQRGTPGYCVVHHMMHHAVPQDTVVPWGTALCSAILHSPEAKSHRIIWCVVQREHIVENPCDLLGFKT